MDWWRTFSFTIANRVCSIFQLKTIILLCVLAQTPNNYMVNGWLSLVSWFSLFILHIKVLQPTEAQSHIFNHWFDQYNFSQIHSRKLKHMETTWSQYCYCPAMCCEKFTTGNCTFYPSFFMKFWQVNIKYKVKLFKNSSRPPPRYMVEVLIKFESQMWMVFASQKPSTIKVWYWWNPFVLIYSCLVDIKPPFDSYTLLFCPDIRGHHEISK